MDTLNSLPAEPALALLRAMRDEGVGAPADIRLAIRDVLEAVPTALQSASIARDVGLPPPHRDRLSAPVITDPAEPIHLRRLQLRDARVWGELDLQLPAADPKQGTWLIFVGPNGSGKTTLLRALALCFVDAPTGDGLLQEMHGPLSAVGADEATASVDLSAGRSASVRVRGTYVVPNGPPPDLFVVGYGPRRGTALGVTRQDVRFVPSESLHTLFVEGGNLIHASSWLKDLHHRHLEKPGGEAEAILRSVRAALTRVLPGVTDVVVSGAGVEVTFADRAPLPLESLSDGYLTTAGWIIDLIARWIHRQRGSVPPDLLGRMTGIVLIDELDLHLHPRWQWQIVEAIRELLPRMSFIATTHNPITLLGARPSEVAVIELDPRGRARAELRDIPPATNAEELLTGPWFGLPSTLDHVTLDLLERQRTLLRSGGPQEDLERVRRELEVRFRRQPFTGVEQEAERVLAMERDKRLAAMTPDERKAAQERAAEALRAALRSRR